MKKCKSKDCQNILPDGDNHKYCKSCRSKRVKIVRDGFAKVGKGVVAVGALAVAGVRNSDKLKQAALAGSEVVRQIVNRL